jgi:outer membrane lipoprotein-sorting protein
MARGRINNVMRGGEGSYARYLERPGRLRIEIMPEQGGEVRVLADGRGWQGDVKQLHRARPVTVQAMVYQLSYLDLPMSLTDKSVPVFYGGSRVLEGQTFDLLELTPAGGSRGVRVYVDKESRLIVRVAADFDMGMGASELSTRYEDFRKVDGVLFPFRLINYAGDMTLSVITITDLKINDPLAPGLFSGGEGN